MTLNESDTRSKLIDPALFERGWTEDNIKREYNAGAIEIIGDKTRRGQQRIDYVLRFRVNSGTEPVPVAIIEAKAEKLPPTHGLEQAKGYADCKRLNVTFAFTSNGHLFIEFDRMTGQTSQPKPMSEFPTPDELRERYEAHVGFSLAHPAARPLITPYTGGAATRRYYQDAAIRAVFEKLARCEIRNEPPRALLSLATGAGKTFIATHLLKRIADSGKPLKALFVCDRDELRQQASGSFQNLFGANAAIVSTKASQKNARVLIATYQTLDVADEEGTANFLNANYPENYFTHIVIDECHRSAWGKWSQIFTRNPNAVQIGLTATPRQITTKGTSSEARADAAITADNIRHFGEPVYEYEIGQGIEDGYLAACEIFQSHINIDGQGVKLEDVRARNPVDAITGAPVSDDQLQTLYERTDFETRLLLPDRVKAMCEDLFDQLLGTGGPDQKVVIFCVRDRHADDVAAEMNNLYHAWCAENGVEPAPHYAFKCTAASSGNDYLADLRGSSQDYFVATTVELLTTGVDIPALQHVVFFRYVRSPIAFYQMVGRGTRIDIPTGKLMFRVHDYTNATRLFGEEFVTRRPSSRKSRTDPSTTDDGFIDPFAEDEEEKHPTVVWVEGFDVQITLAGQMILTTVDGQTKPVSVEVYKQMLAEKLVTEAPTIDDFRELWVKTAQRQALLAALPDGNRSALLIRTLDSLQDCDLYDVLAELGYGADPRTRIERTEAFPLRNDEWLKNMESPTVATIHEIVSLFKQGGVEELENKEIFNVPRVKRAGGLDALKLFGKPAKVVEETKRRLFAI